MKIPPEENDLLYKGESYGKLYALVDDTVQPKVHVHYVCIAGFLLTFFVYNYKIHYIGKLSNQIE